MLRLYSVYFKNHFSKFTDFFKLSTDAVSLISSVIIVKLYE